MRQVIAALICTSMAISPLSFAKGSKGGGSRPSYSGSSHSGSHGGHYFGGSGSSHEGGEYKNANSGDRYGKHDGSK